tara:strand:+ start:103 stop:621 length:519 start_codon:yes stop_codon:yes gene_type:complete
MGKYLTAGTLTENGAGAMRTYGFQMSGKSDEHNDDATIGVKALGLAERFCNRYQVTPCRIKLDTALKSFGITMPMGKARTHDHMHVMSYDGEAPIIISHPYVDPEVLVSGPLASAKAQEYEQSFRAMGFNRHWSMIPELITFATDSWYYPDRTLGLVLMSKALFTYLKTNEL